MPGRNSIKRIKPQETDHHVMLYDNYLFIENENFMFNFNLGKHIYNFKSFRNKIKYLISIHHMEVLIKITS